MLSEQLKKIYQEAPLERIQKYLPYLNKTVHEFEINTPSRLAHFLAQIGHESGQLRYVEELASGEAYEGRLDLGNTTPGDGVRYKGRGLLQITGHHNYALASLSMDLPLLETPELLTTPENASRSAGWFWYNKNLNSYADLDDLVKITKIVNGGLNGFDDRYKLLLRAKAALFEGH